MKRASPRRKFSPTSLLPDVLVADANVLLSAIIGGRAAVALADPRLPRIVAPAEVGDEILEHLPAIARKRRLDLGVLLPVIAALPVEWIDAAAYTDQEAEARRRMTDRDEDDWPVVALALSLQASTAVVIWTQDRDFEVSGIRHLTTGDLLDTLREVVDQ